MSQAGAYDPRWTTVPALERLDVVVVEEAGGRFSDLWGGRRLDTRTAIYSNSVLHDDLRVRAATLAPDTPERHYDQQ